MNKKKLSVILSKLEGFFGDVKLEQYMTDPEIAADILWFVHLHGDLEGKTIADLGCGNGILGIGALNLGAEKVYFVDVDKKMIDLAKKNCKFKNSNFLNEDVSSFDKKVDVVIQNSPFGVKNKKADEKFLKKAFEISDKVYSFHKIESKDFIEKISSKNGFKVNKVLKYDFYLKRSMKFHKRKEHKVVVGCWVLERKALKS